MFKDLREEGGEGVEVALAEGGGGNRACLHLCTDDCCVDVRLWSEGGGSDRLRWCGG